jgi:hypothetical protein
MPIHQIAEGGLADEWFADARSVPAEVDLPD